MTTDRPHTVAGLLDKRREIAGKIEHAQAAMRQLVVDLDALDAVIRLFDPDAIPGEPKRYPAQAIAFRGEITRIVRTALREASGPLTTPEIARKVVEGRGLNPEDHAMRKTIQRRVGLCLRRMKSKGTVRAAPLGRFMGWERA